MKKLILIIGDSQYQFDSKDDLYNEILGTPEENYLSLPEEKKANRRLEKANQNMKFKKDTVTTLADSTENDIDSKSKIFVDTDESYLLSLLNLNVLTLLEEKSSNQFTSSIDKSDIENNYVIVNRFAPSLLKCIRKQLKSKVHQNPQEIEQEGPDFD